MTDLSAEFLSIAAAAGSLADREADLDEEALSALESAAEQVGRSWSKASLGYQANVYYEGFKVPPAGHMFSREWGFLGTFHGTVGDWKPSAPPAPTSWMPSRRGRPRRWRSCSSSVSSGDGSSPDECSLP